MQFDFGCNTICVRDNEHWREMIANMADDLFAQAGVDTEIDEFDDFKYDVLEDVVMDVIQDALNYAISDRRLTLDNFKDFFDEVKEMYS